MCILFFVLWLLLNAHFALDIAMLEIVIIGAALSVALYFFMIKFTRWTFEFDIFFIKNIHLFCAYAAVLFWNILVSNFHVIGVILRPGERPDPYIVSVDIPIKNEMLRSIMANSITLTPGTITIECTAKHFVVHCLKEEYIEGIESCALAKILIKMEARMK